MKPQISPEYKAAKVPYCQDCKEQLTPEELVTTTNENKKTIQVCPYCGERVHLVHPSRIKADNFVEGERKHAAQEDPGSPRDSVTRTFLSPWGTVKAHISVRSFFAPFVQLNGKSCPAIKRMIDEEFSKESIEQAYAVLYTKKTAVNIWQNTLSDFAHKLRHLVESIHLDPQAAESAEVDLVMGRSKW